MKVLHFIAGDFTGGAAKGALLLHKSLLNKGVNSVVISNSENCNEDKSIVFLTKSFYFKFKFKIYRFLSRLPLFLYPNKNSKIQFSTGWDGIDITKLQGFNDADIIHLHWINGLVRLSSLEHVNKPIVWTIRDMWPITGGCHVALSENLFCINHENGCGNCPLLSSNYYPDLSRIIYSKKIGLFQKRSIEIVGISKWITNLASKSDIFRSSNFHYIPNNIDTNLFKPLDRELARNEINLKLDDSYRVISVGAHDLLMRHKGFYEFKESLKYLDTDKIVFLFFGFVDKSELEGLNINFLLFGYVSNNYTLRSIYCASDLFLAPSLIESFGKTLAEAHSCNIPVVCFDSTGTSDIVKHKLTGYKAKSYDPEDLANGVKWVFGLGKVQYDKVSKNARNWVLENFDSELIAQKYVELYKKKITQNSL